MNTEIWPSDLNIAVLRRETMQRMQRFFTTYNFVFTIDLSS